MIRIRAAAVAGSFYPADPVALRRAVVRAVASAECARASAPPVALIVPHAGYVYSGDVAASAYASLQPWAAHYRRVLLLGPAHYAAVPGLAVPPVDVFRTPLGDIPLDHVQLDRLRHPAISMNAEAHAHEHCLEVQLPFLQVVLPDFLLLPLVVGRVEAASVAAVIESLWTGSDTLIVVSSDLSHYLDYDTARRRDRHTCAAIEALDGGHIDQHDACGASPLRGLLHWARAHRLRVETLDLRNSGDTAGDRSRVVGYGAWRFTGDPCAAAA